MNRLLRILLVFAVVSALSFVLYAREGNEAVPTATISVESSQSLYQNGDVISITGENFAPSDNIRMVTLTVIDYESKIIKDVILENHSLVVDNNGILSGTLQIGGVPESANEIEILVYAEYSNVRGSNRMKVIGNSLPISGDINFIETAGTVTIDDPVVGGRNSDGDGVASTSEDIDLSGSGWTGTLLIVSQREFSNVGGTNFIQATSLSTSNASIDGGGNLSGYVTTTSSYHASTLSIRMRVLNSDVDQTDSNTMPTPDSDPPDISSASATTLTNIRVVFDEPVELFQTGPENTAYANFGISGSDAGSASAGASLTAVGSSPSDTWDLGLNGTLANRGPNPANLTVTYTQGVSDDGLQDQAGNEVSDGSNSSVDDTIPPEATTLLDSTDNTLTLADYVASSGSYPLGALVTNGNLDPSLDGVLFEGSNNGTSWSSTGLGTDPSPTASGDDADFGVSWNNSSNQYRMLRAISFDDAGAGGANGTLDADDNSDTTVVGSSTDDFNMNFLDTYRAVITSVNPDPVTASSGSIRSQITVTMQDNYGNAINTTGFNQTFRLSDDDDTETWWDASSGGTGSSTQIDLTVTTASNSGSVWYSNTASGGPNTLVLTEPSGNFAANSGVVSANGQTISVSTGDPSKIWIRFAGQTFTSGIGVTGTPNSHLATDTLQAKLFVTDDANNLASTFNSSPTHTLVCTTSASNAPDGTQPSVDGDTDLTIDVAFASGVATVVVRYPNAETGVTLEANESTEPLTGVTSSGVDINPGTLEQFSFVMATPQRDGQTVTGTNNLTAQDTYENVVTSFDASSNNVTITGSGPGSATITGLGSGDNNVLNQAGDFTNGVANLTSQAMVIDVTITGVYSFTATSSDSKTGTASNIAVNKLVTVSGPNTSANTLIDTTGSATDFLLSASLSGSEDAVDDFRIRWGFNTSGTAGSYFLTRQSSDLTPGGTIQYTVPAASVKALGAPADYMFWWVENISTDPAATILEGLPTSATPRRLILNPNLITEGGIGGGDFAQGDFAVGVNNQEVVSILFKSDPSPATIRIISLTFDKSGSAGTNDIDQFHLYLDGGTLGTYDPGTDVLLKDVTFSGGSSVVFSDISNLNISGTSNYILVTVDVKSGATPTNTLGLNLNNQTSISLDDNVFNGPASSITKNSFSNLGTSMDYSLPVDLVSFVASATYGKVVLEWETASEVNNEGFFIYRSSESDGFYEEVNSDIIDGNGNSNTVHTYRYEDKNVVEGKTYFYKLYSRDFNGQINEYPSIVSATVLEIPRSFQIEQNYPNPFNPSTRFRFSIAEPSQASLIIYNVLGQKIRTLFDNNSFEPGVYEEFFWDATDDAGNTVANGVYYYEFRVLDKNVRQVKKMLYLK